LQEAIPSQKEHAMPSAPARETPKPIPDAPPDLSGSWLVDPEASHAGFVARSLFGLVKTPGRFRSLSGDLDVGEARTAGALAIDTSSIDTGNGMRDGHLRSRAFFDVKRHPRLSYEAHSISSQDPGTARIDGELIVKGTRTPLPLDATLHAPAPGVVELACRTEVDRLALGIRGSRGMVPRTVELVVTIRLRRAVA
jgi:polyisoprenoid-binding protein YceI